MTAVSSLDALFSRKGEAAPAVQAAIPTPGRSRFEDLARSLGSTEAIEDDDADRPDDGAGLDAVVPAGPAEQGARVHAAPARPRPHLVPDAEAAPVDGGMIRRAAPVEDGPTRPWHHLRETLARRRDAGDGAGRSAAAAGPMPSRRGAAASPAAVGRGSRGTPPPWVALCGSPSDLRQTLAVAPAEDPEDLEVYLFGSDRDVDAAESGVAEAAADRPPPRRRQVSVRLPAREHDLLRQFAKVCGTTQQHIVRRALLTFMIEELRRQLDGTPAATVPAAAPRPARRSERGGAAPAPRRRAEPGGAAG